MGDLIRMPHSELHATIELLDRLGVTPHDFEVLRKASSWSQTTTARVHKTDPSVWAALELEDALVRLGFMPGEIRALAGRKDLLQLVRQALCGAVGIGPVQHIIDCDAKPFEPSGLTVAPESDQLPNRVRGQLVFDSTNIKLHLSSNQQGGKYIGGEKLKKELALVWEPMLPANVLDFYLANHHLIPDEWKKDERGNIRFIFFWGTIYRGAGGLLYVRFLYFDDGRWYSDYGRLDDVWDDRSPAPVCASI